jgi:carbon-monoxide dehydrogenase small subunit
MSLRKEIQFTVNGAPRRLQVPVTMSALTLIREELGLTGTKYGCGEGECGACTIHVDGEAVNACLMFAVDCDGRTIATIEAVAAEPVGTRLRDAFVANGAVQCGFCTPGIVMQAAALLTRSPHAGREEIQRGIEGNLCRCTGYVKIVEAIAAAAGGD